VNTNDTASTHKNMSIFSSSMTHQYENFLQSYHALQGLEAICMVTHDKASAEGAKETTLKIDPNIKFTSAIFKDVGFLTVPLSLSNVCNNLTAFVKKNAQKWATLPVLVIDMRWGIATNSTAANFDQWAGEVEQLCKHLEINIVSLYNRQLIFDGHLATALHGHPYVLSARDLQPNPHWLPPSLHQKGTQRQKFDFLLEALIHPGNPTQTSHGAFAAEGTDPGWLPQSDPGILNDRTQSRAVGWEISCLGALQLRSSEGIEAVWKTYGGSTKKTKALFAYLLHKGAQGASAEELADFLWPDCPSCETGRNRLHHTVRSLRKVLKTVTDEASETPPLLRVGNRYILCPPANSWLDLTSFEQACRQSEKHILAGASEEALSCLHAADRLYLGDLFSDIGEEYVDGSERDWCWSKQYWLRDMFHKIQRELARLYREKSDYSAALIHCKKSLDVDELCETAHQETMRVYFAQGRGEAVERQYKIYTRMLKKNETHPAKDSVTQLYKDLMIQLES